jgi:hypothetical protein
MADVVIESLAFFMMGGMSTANLIAKETKTGIVITHFIFAPRLSFDLASFIHVVSTNLPALRLGDYSVCGSFFDFTSCSNLSNC